MHGGSPVMFCSALTQIFPVTFGDAIDPWDHTAHLTKESMSISLVPHYQNSSTTVANLVRLKTYKG